VAQDVRVKGVAVTTPLDASSAGVGRAPSS